MGNAASQVCPAELEGLTTAWQMWMSGQKLETCRLCSLWCLDVIWWGRLGKIIALIAGLVVLLDIAGEDKIRKLGEWLTKKTGGFHGTFAMLADALNSVTWVFLGVLSSLVMLLAEISNRLINVLVIFLSM
jgi:hypothetical protein